MPSTYGPLVTVVDPASPAPALAGVAAPAV